MGAPPVSANCRIIISSATTFTIIPAVRTMSDSSQKGARYFQDKGIEVVHDGPAGLPSDQRAIHPGQLYEWVRANTPRSAEAVFIGGNGFRAIGVIKTLEEDLARPVLTANQVAFWQALRILRHAYTDCWLRSDIRPRIAGPIAARVLRLPSLAPLRHAERH